MVLIEDLLKEKIKEMKSFKLPKEFTKKWLEELRSGDYVQGKGTLVDAIEYDDDAEPLLNKGCKYCCLGLGLKISGYEINDMYGKDLPEDIDFHKDKIFPRALVDENKTALSNGLLVGSINYKTTNLITILTFLNDGLTYNTYQGIKEVFPDLIFTKIPTDKTLVYSFQDIANWIEDNVEPV